MYPTIDAEKCIGCSTCIDFCKNGVLDFDENAQKARVRAPFNCVVECSTGGRLCPLEAMYFPERKEFVEIIHVLLQEARLAK